MNTRETYQFFLYDLFHNLKEFGGIELDFNQYERFIHLFSSGILNVPGDQDNSEAYISRLRNLCIALWVTKAKYLDFFNAQFDHSIKHWFDSPEEEPDISSTLSSKGPPSGEASPPKSTEEKKSGPTTTGNEETSGTEGDENGALDDPNEEKDKKSAEVSDEETVKEEVFINFRQGGEIHSEYRVATPEVSVPFIFTDEKHLPFPPRRVHQLWKKVKTYSKKIEGDQIAIKETIEAYIKNKTIQRPVYELIKSGKQRFFLFIEQDGPMIAYRDWANYLINDLRRADVNNKVETYYFTNYPQPVQNKGFSDYQFYTTPMAITTLLLSKLCLTISKHDIVIFFSDAGAIDNSVNNNRLTHTLACLKLFRENTKNIVWINPVIDRSRWEHTSAAYLALFCDMQPFQFKGIMEAIKMIRE